MQRATVLATDMDGTFIPLKGNSQNRQDLTRLIEELRQRKMELVYVTGRHRAMVLDAIESEQLPVPRWLICDVGTSIYCQRSEAGYELLQEYHQYLAERIAPMPLDELRQRIGRRGSLRLQEPEKQGDFKLSYYSDATTIDQESSQLRQLLEKVKAPYDLIASVDPFNGDGLIDFLPRDVSKASALQWWVEHAGLEVQSVIFAGDSGNDLAALTAGYRSIVVGNAERAIAQHAKATHEASGWSDRLHLAKAPATSGVLEGLLHFCD